MAMAFLTGWGAYRLQGSKNGYAWLIFIVTLSLTGWLPAQNPSDAFDIAVMRSSTICLGVVLSFSVHGLLWPIRAGKVFEDQLQGFLNRCRELVLSSGQILAGDKPDSADIKKIETTQFKALTALRSSLDAATSDTARFKKFNIGYAQLIDQLHNLLLAIIAVRVDIESCPEGLARQSLLKKSHTLGSMLKTVEDAMETLVGDLTQPRDGTAKSPEASSSQLDSMPTGTIDTAFTAMTEAKIHDLAAQLQRVRTQIVSVEDPEQKHLPQPPASKIPFSFKSSRFQKAAIGSLVILLTTSLFIVTQWPGGLQLSMIFVTLAIGFSAMMPIMLISQVLLFRLFISAVVAAPLYLYIMPGISQFEQLIPWLCLVFVPLLYLESSSKPKIMLGALFSGLFIIILLSLDEESQSYAFSTFINSWFGLCGGFVIPVLIFYLLNTLVPERLFSEQVSAFFTGCGHFMHDLKESPPGTPAAESTIKVTREHWQARLKQLQLWSSMINHTRMPSNNQNKTRELVESIERVALQLASAEYARRKPLFEPLREQFYLLHDSCIESCQLIAGSLAKLKPVPGLPACASIIHNIQAQGDQIRRAAGDDKDILISLQNVMSVTTHMSLLADELNTCREKANALDWKGWNQNYF